VTSARPGVQVPFLERLKIRTTKPSRAPPFRPASVSTTSLSDGSYSLSLDEGVYTVTASATGYFPETANGIAVNTDANTSLSFALNTTKLRLLSTNPTHGSLGQSLDVELTGSGFVDGETRVSMTLDSGRAIIGSAGISGGARGVTLER
jgi:hypothetical protein